MMAKMGRWELLARDLGHEVKKAEAEVARLQTALEGAERERDEQGHTASKLIIELDQVTDERDGYKAQSRLRGEALEAVEWRGGVGGLRQCPRCDMPRKHGHAPYCLLRAAIDIKPEEAREKEGK